MTREPRPTADLHEVVVRFDGRTVLGPVSLRIEPRQRWVLLGPNGCGKTTLTSVIGARLWPSSGTASVLGVRFGRGDLRPLRGSIGHSSHALAERFAPRMSMLDVVLTGKGAALSPWFQTYDDTDVARAMNGLELVGCGPLAERTFERCSQGERQRAVLARAMFGEPDLLVLDEPAAGLDLPSRERLVSAIDASAARRPKLVVVIATHHLEEIPRSATHAALLRNGGLVAAGPIEQVLTPEPLSACFDLPIEVGRRDGRWFGAAAGN